MKRVLDVFAWLRESLQRQAQHNKDGYAYFGLKDYSVSCTFPNQDPDICQVYAQPLQHT